MRISREAQQRFWSKVRKSKGCWIWKGTVTDRGYGRFCYEGKSYSAHRFHWLWKRGTIPNETLDHLCRRRSCIRLSHLEAVSVKENVLRGDGITAKHSRKTHCVNGHPFSGDNLAYWGKSQQRQCRTCKAHWSKAWQAKNRERFQTYHRDYMRRKSLERKRSSS